MLERLTKIYTLRYTTHRGLSACFFDFFLAYIIDLIVSHFWRLEGQDESAGGVFS